MNKECLGKGDAGIRGKRFNLPIPFKLFLKIKEKQETPEFRQKLRERMWKLEGLFGEAKYIHGMGRARYRGRSKVQIQVYAIATVQNLKRLANAVFGDLILILFKLTKLDRLAIFSEDFFETRAILSRTA